MIILNKKTYMLLKKLKKYSPSTYEHSIRVANISSEFAERLELDNDAIEKLKVVGLLHDIGKLSVPKKILDKPSKLTKEEYDKIKNHTTCGVALLIKSGFKDKKILNLILCHHERPDGLGYPNNLKGDTIPDLAKIIAITDCYDAMASKRPYKDSKDIEYIKNEFINNAGTQFDFNYAHLFLSYLDNKNSKKPLK